MGRRKHGLFLPDENSLGGAMQLNATYHNYWKTLNVKAELQPATARPPTAQQLSLHRARKLAQVDPTAINHQINMHHHHRRMQDVHGAAAHHKQSQQPLPYQTPPRRSLRPNSAARSMCPWLPQTHTGSRRPSTAPGALSRPSSASSNQQLTDWQTLKRYAHPELQPPAQPVTLPPSRYYTPGPNLLPSVQHKLYKAAIMQDVLERQLYRAKDIRALCSSYLLANPAEHRELLRGVVAEVLKELDIQ